MNGAHFDTAKGTTFLGFKDPAYPEYFGKSNYLAGTTSLSGIMYVDSTTTVHRFWQCVGRSSLESNWNAKLPTIIPAKSTIRRLVTRNSNKLQQTPLRRKDIHTSRCRICRFRR